MLYLFPLSLILVFICLFLCYFGGKIHIMYHLTSQPFLSVYFSGVKYINIVVQTFLPSILIILFVL